MQVELIHALLRVLPDQKSQWITPRNFVPDTLPNDVKPLLWFKKFFRAFPQPCSADVLSIYAVWFGQMPQIWKMPTLPKKLMWLCLFCLH